MIIDKDVLLQFIRIAYLHGGNDDNFQWCEQGSTEVAEELLEQLCEEWRVDTKDNRGSLIGDLTDSYVDLVKDKESALNYAMGESRQVNTSKLAIEHLKRNVAIHIDSILRNNSF